MSGHGITACKICRKVVIQCRCIGPHEIEYTATCDDCARKALEIQVWRDPASLSIEERLRALLRSKSGSIHLTFNEHEGYYDSPGERTDEDTWVSAEEKHKAITTNSVWTLQWYPDTPVGFYVLTASSLEAVLAAAEKVK